MYTCAHVRLGYGIASRLLYFFLYQMVIIICYFNYAKSVVRRHLVSCCYFSPTGVPFYIVNILQWLLFQFPVHDFPVRDYTL